MGNPSKLFTYTVILGGNGAVGSLFCDKLSSCSEKIISIDLQTKTSDNIGNIHYICSDACHLSHDAQEAINLADLVIVALPEPIAHKAWRQIVGHQKKAALFVDTLSVKQPFVEAISTSDKPDEIISINPMFAPSLGFSGQSMIVSEIRRGPIANNFLSLIKQWDCQIIQLAASQHDQYTAVLQAATHAAIISFGITMMNMNYDITIMDEIMPPPHRAMMALLARILSIDPEVYWDIQSSSVYATEARDQLKNSIEVLSELVDGHNQNGFNELLKQLKTLFRSSQEDKFTQSCAEMFTTLSSTRKKTHDNQA